MNPRKLFAAERCVQRYGADEVDDGKVAHRDLHTSIFVELALRSEKRESCGNWATRTCASDRTRSRPRARAGACRSVPERAGACRSVPERAGACRSVPGRARTRSDESPCVYCNGNAHAPSTPSTPSTPSAQTDQLQHFVVGAGEIWDGWKGCKGNAGTGSRAAAQLRLRLRLSMAKGCHVIAAIGKLL